VGYPTCGRRIGLGSVGGSLTPALRRPRGWKTTHSTRAVLASTIGFVSLGGYGHAAPVIEKSRRLCALAPHPPGPDARRITRRRSHARPVQTARVPVGQRGVGRPSPPGHSSIECSGPRNSRHQFEPVGQCLSGRGSRAFTDLAGGDLDIQGSAGRHRATGNGRFCRPAPGVPGCSQVGSS